jgi:hypothetical protein
VWSCASTEPVLPTLLNLDSGGPAAHCIDQSRSLRRLRRLPDVGACAGGTCEGRAPSRQDDLLHRRRRREGVRSSGRSRKPAKYGIDLNFELLPFFGGDVASRLADLVLDLEDFGLFSASPSPLDACSTWSARAESPATFASALSGGCQINTTAFDDGFVTDGLRGVIGQGDWSEDKRSNLGRGDALSPATFASALSGGCQINTTANASPRPRFDLLSSLCS